MSPSWLDPAYIAVAVAVVWWRLSSAEKQLKALAEELQQHRLKVESMDRRFWTEEWPKVSAVIPRVDALETTVVRIEERIDRLEDGCQFRHLKQ